MGDDWVLSEWYPNSPALKKLAEPTKKPKRRTRKRKSSKKHSAATEAAPSDAKSEAAPTSIKAEGGETLTDTVEKLLIKSGKPMGVTEMLPKLSALGKQPLKHNLARTLRTDPKKRFKDLGDGEFDLIRR